MPFIKISELPSATTPLTGTELVEIVQGGASRKVAASEFGGSPDLYPATSRVLHVGSANGMYSTIQDALTAAAALSPSLSSTDRCQILVYPGTYTMTATLSVPSYVSIKGVDKFSVRLINATTDLFTVTGPNTHFSDFLIEGSANTAICAFNCNNQNAVHIRRVDMLNNGGVSTQRFVQQIGSTWAVLFIEDCVVDTFRTSNAGGAMIALQNTSGSASRFVDTIINNIFLDSFFLTDFATNIQVRNCSDVRIRNSTIRGAATFHTGVRVERSGATGTSTAHIRHSYLEGGVPVFGEASTNYFLLNTDAVGSLTSGTRTLRNSSV